MSEFKEKLQDMKEGLTNSLEDNPAFISSDLVDDDNNEVISSDFLDNEENSRIQSTAVQRNEKGHRKRKNLKERLDVVLAENRAKDSENQQLRAYVQEQERRLSEAQARVEQSAHYTNAYYEQSLENDEQRVLSELEIAKENGDIKKEVALHHRLSEIAADKKAQALSKTLQRQQPSSENYLDNFVPPNYYQEPIYNNQSIYQEPVNEHYEDWLEDNPWADPQSSEYDQNLSAEVNEIAVELNKNLKFKRHGSMIGTPEYFNALSNIMNDRYGGSSNSYKDDSEYIDNSYYEVAPVTKRGSSMADRYVSQNQNYNRSQRPQMNLTKDEYEVASKLAPTLASIYKRPVTTEEAVAEYYRQKVSSMPKRR